MLQNALNRFPARPWGNQHIIDIVVPDFQSKSITTMLGMKNHLIDLHLCVHTLSLVIDFLYCRRQTRCDINLGHNLSYPVFIQNSFVPYTMSNSLAVASVLSVGLPRHTS